MTRRLSIALAALASAASLGVSLTSCNTPSCGPGTVQQQQKDGTLKCVPVDQQEAGIACDVDGGNAAIVGGKCVSAIECDPATTVLVNGVCVGIGTGHPMCHNPAAGKACIDGKIIDFKSNMPGSTPIDVLLYNPTDLLTGGAPLMTCTSDGASFVCQDFTPPGLGLVTIITGMTTTGFTGAGTGGQGIGAAKYTIDTYEVKKADADAWGFDYTTNGAFIAKFYDDPKPTGNVTTVATDTDPVSGVTLYKDGAAAAGAQYFNATLTMVDPTLTTGTGTSGAAIVASPVSGNFPIFTGMGGMDKMGMPITWEQLPGGSKMGVIIIVRFHPM